MLADVLGWQQTLQLLLRPLQQLSSKPFDWRLAEASLYCIRSVASALPSTVCNVCNASWEQTDCRQWCASCLTHHYLRMCCVSSYAAAFLSVLMCMGTVYMHPATLADSDLLNTLLLMAGVCCNCHMQYTSGDLRDAESTVTCLSCMVQCCDPWSYLWHPNDFLPRGGADNIWVMCCVIRSQQLCVRLHLTPHSL